MSRKTYARAVTICLLIALYPLAGLAGETVRTDVLVDEGDRIVLDYRFGDYLSRTVEIEGRNYQEIWFESEPVALERGAPALPHVNRSVIVPDDARMTLRVVAAEYDEVFAKIAPSKGSLPRSVDPGNVAYEFGAVYGTNTFFPGPLAQLGSPYILRDHRGITVAVNPFQYNPVTGVLRVYTDVTVEITAAGPGQVNVLHRGARATRFSRAFNDLYRSHFSNYRQVAYDPIGEEGEMLIICHDAWIANMAPFVAHKADVGIAATVVGVSEIGNDPSSIKSYIQSVYDAGNLAFVLLVGDIDEVDSPMYMGGASDPEYSKLAGGDPYPEILVGRFSARTTEELDTQVQRTITYETLPATEQDWFWKGTGIASAEGAGMGDEGQGDWQHASEIRDWLLAAGYSEVDEIYDPGANSLAVTDAVHAGRGVINYTGHGSPWGWSTSGFDTGDVDALTNTGMLPFIVSVACNNGEFESYGSCFAETWLRATNGGEPTGAIGVYASSISQYWAEPMEGQDEFNLLLTDVEQPYFSFGALCFAGSCSMMDDYGSSGIDMFNTWILFGDPSLHVVGAFAPHGLIVDPPIDSSAEGPAGGPFAPAAVEYTLQNLDDEPLEYQVVSSSAWITVDDDQGTIPALGATTVTLSVADSARNFDNGAYAGGVEFINLTNHVGNTTRSLSLEVGLPVLRHAWDLADSPGWLTEGKWEFGQPTGQGGDYLGYPDPVSGATGDDVYGVNLHGDYLNFVGMHYYLTAGPMDLTGVFSPSLRFQRWLNIEGSPYASAEIEVSDDGSAWTEVWQGRDGITEDQWSPQSHDIPEIAAGQPEVYLRWGYGVDMIGAVPCSGWNLDDVEVWGIPETARFTLTLGEEQLLWTPLAGAVAYDVVQGDLETLRSSGGDFTAATDVCVHNDAEDQSLVHADIPGPGSGQWYLVRGISAEGPMTYQALFDSQVGLRDEEIAANPNACP